jgi:hypothetical protein
VFRERADRGCIEDQPQECDLRPRRGTMTSAAGRYPHGAAGHSRGPASGFNLLLTASERRVPGMFDTITAELTTANDKLSHLRRFL